MISTASLYYLIVLAGPASGPQDSEAILAFYLSKQECELAIYEERIFNSKCLPVNESVK